jgi:hypothetical protein
MRTQEERLAAAVQMLHKLGNQATLYISPPAATNSSAFTFSPIPTSHR